MPPSDTNTIRLHRVLRCPPARLYRAILDPDAIMKWMPPNGFTGKVHSIEAKVGGTYRMSFTNLSNGQAHAWRGKYTDLVTNELVRHTDRFEDPNLPGEMTTTLTLRAVSVGTDLTIVQEGIPSAIPTEACYLGWQESLILLTKLVEAEIPG
jgi:uncharacterized protein YndB with AHSA1/START domain